uniref:Ig-like domain-containing protein n=1 Tax=Astatotilapia calliptera TaxID=8154 RepID=A0A3P8QLE3_ASTCA
MSLLCSALLFVGCIVYFDSFNLAALLVSLSDPNIITAESGQNVTLPCRVTASPGEDAILQCQGPGDVEITLLQWSKPELKSDGYVYFYRNQRLYENYQHSFFKGRVELRDPSMKDGDCSVILRNASIRDAGTYECRITTRRSKGVQSEFKHSIKLTVKSSGEFVEKNITAESGQSVTLTCRAPNNNNDIVEWSRADLEPKHDLVYRGGNLVSDEQHPSFKDRVDLQGRQMKDGDVSLIVMNLTINDTGTYECRAFTSGTNCRKKANRILGFFLYTVPYFQRLKNVTLPCRASNKNIIILEWSRADLGTQHVVVYRDGQFAPDDQHPSFKNRVDLQDRQMKDGDVSLILNNVTTADSGTYECRVLRGEIHSWELNIIYLSVVDSPGE